MADGNNVPCIKASKVGIIGSGLIGRQWSILFSSAGFEVVIYDVDQKQLDCTLNLISEQMHALEKQGVSRGSLTIRQRLDLIRTTNNLSECVSGAKYVQECVPENLEIKQKVFKELNGVHTGHTIIASSTSTITPSTFMKDLNNNEWFLVAHPVNPPVLVPLVEVVPSQWTSQECVRVTLDLLRQIGQTPVLLRKEVQGFAVNRLQYALLVECANMVEEGIMSSSDIDKVMSEGLGMRYFFMGPLQTAHLNATGWKQYMDFYGESINKVLETFKHPPRLGGEGVKKVIEEMTQDITIDQIEERRKWRDNRLAELTKLKRQWESE